jgi:hypothetical protein
MANDAKNRIHVSPLILSVGVLVLSFAVGWGTLVSNSQSLNTSVKEVKRELSRHRQQFLVDDLADRFEEKFRDLVEAIERIEKKIQ